ncbi:MAG: NUDIX hydrolase [Acidimicrobiales bacterium]
MSGSPPPASRATSRSGELRRAAGGVLWRRATSQTHQDAGANTVAPAALDVDVDVDVVEVVVVHRPHRQDWSLPKGHLEAGETPADAALREVLEETGYRARLGPALGTTSYRDHKGRPKMVWYFAMQLGGGGDGADEPAAELHDGEVDEVVWLSLADARARVSYDSDREVLDRFAALPDHG